MNYCTARSFLAFRSLLLLIIVLTGSFQHTLPAKEPTVPVPADTEFVEVNTLIPNIVIDLPYATDQNFFKKRFYSANRCFLRRGVILKLAEVQKDLNAQGLGLKIWDGYRPRRVQWEFWKVMPNPAYVADPKEGSRHNRGAAVDVTLVDLATGAELAMPTGFDDFSPKAAADFKLLLPEALKNRTRLTTTMKKHGFSVLPSEWWHFDSDGWQKYPLEDRDLLGETAK
ncbi:MAG: M15 family metallopeptidase [Verrucomicrobium sp.]|nr:M15 family metallopeptidase [Verrucomicrobium sp.]